MTAAGDFSLRQDTSLTLDASVIICAHNPSQAYLKRTLDALAAQTLPENRWELLLIDNASQTPLASAWDFSRRQNSRHVFEAELGLASARLRGMKEARSDLLVFVDDDNVLDPNYLARAVKIKDEWPRLGVWGAGAIAPEFEVEPDTRVSKIVPYLALREVARPRWSNFATTEATPWGAGLCLRKAVAEAYARNVVQSSIAISGRKGAALMSGDDLELSYVACDMGFGIGIFPELRLVHLISSRRVAKEYLLRIVEGTYVSNALLAYKWKGARPRSPLSLRGLLSAMKQLLLLSGIDRETYIVNLRATMKAVRIIEEVEARRAKTTCGRIAAAQDLGEGV